MALKSCIANLKVNGETLRINYTEKSPPVGTYLRGHLLLVHGFPQTSYQFRRVIGPLAAAGYHVIAPDYRGAGASSKPVSGYTKTQMAQDLRTLIREHLKIKSPELHVIGHDIGAMIAHAYAMLYPDEISSVIWGECPLPGTRYFDELDGTVEHFHFVFHQVLDLPELLIAGKEREYLKHFYDREGYNSAAITKEDVDHYAMMFSQPGAMRGGINLYRAFHEDAEQNKAMFSEKGKCRVRCLLLNGAKGWLHNGAKDMGSAFYENVDCATVPESGHYIAEENPEEFVRTVLDFIQK